MIQSNPPHFPPFWNFSTPTETPAWFIQAIKDVLASPNPTPSNVPLKFEPTLAAAVHNQSVLSSFNDDIENFIAHHPNSVMSYGSEFRKTNVLAPLLHLHPNWPKLRQLLELGSCWPVSRISNHDRIAKNNELAKRGNHKSAATYSDFLTSSLAKEIKQGWMIPLPAAYLNKLQHAEIAPIGVAKQIQAHEDGSRSDKFRMVHDQSFEASVGSSINKRVNKDALETLYYGHCLSRMIHKIVAYRAAYPTTRLLAAKSDFKAAYRRITLQGKTAARCTIIHNDLALPGLRLTFGGTPCAYEFCVASETSADLANDILHAPDWDPRELSSPHTCKIPEAKTLPDSIPFGQAAELDVEVPVDCYGCVDDFVDDGIVLVPDINDNRARGAGALTLAIHIICRPLATDEPIARDDPLSFSKLAEEGQLTEKIVILGWAFNLRALTMALPRDKFIHWSSDIDSIILAKSATYSELDTLIGRLNHAGHALPLSRYFLNRVRRTATRKDTEQQERQKSNKIRKWLPKPVIADLQLFSNIFLPILSEGISLNLLAYRRPTHIFWSDACPEGMGGYSQHSGKAWRFRIPPDYEQYVLNSNNLLEFIASVISVWIEILDGAPHHSCFLSFADNTSAVGWLHRANVNEISNKPLETATRHFATLIMQANCCLYPQHFKGSENKVADALSRRFDLTDNQLQSFIFSTLPHQVPSTFSIVPLPPSISSWVIWLLQKIRETKASPKELKTKKHESGNAGSTTVELLKTTTTSTYSDSPHPSAQPCLEPSLQPIEEDNFLALTKKNWELAQSKRPWQSWVRSLGQTWGTTPTMAQARPESLRAYLASSME